jgi:hypothetical protein
MLIMLWNIKFLDIHKTIVQLKYDHTKIRELFVELAEDTITAMQFITRVDKCREPTTGQKALPTTFSHKDSGCKGGPLLKDAIDTFTSSRFNKCLNL